MKIDLSILKTQKDIQDFIDSHEDVIYASDLKKKYYPVYQKAVRLGICSNLIYKKQFYTPMPTNISEWQSFIDRNNIVSPTDFERRFVTKYNKFRKNEEWRLNVVYVGGRKSIRNKYINFKTPEDFQKIIDEFEICSASELELFDPGLYNKLVKLKLTNKVNYKNNDNRLSSLERYIKNFLVEENYVFEVQKTFTWLVYEEPLKLDFYIPGLNVAIECQGVQHYKPVELFGGESSFVVQKSRDKRKYDLCLDNNITIIYIPDKNIDNKLIEESIYYSNTVKTTKELKEKLNSLKTL